MKQLLHHLNNFTQRQATLTRTLALIIASAISTAIYAGGYGVTSSNTPENSKSSVENPVQQGGTIKSLQAISPPESLENIFVQKLATTPHASDFLVFVKHHVPLHKHVHHTETVYVLEGTGEMQLGDKTLAIKPGDFIKIPQGTVHGVTTTSTIPLKVLSVQAPEFFGKDRVPVTAP